MKCSVTFNLFNMLDFFAFYKFSLFDRIFVDYISLA